MLFEYFLSCQVSAIQNGGFAEIKIVGYRSPENFRVSQILIIYYCWCFENIQIQIVYSLYMELFTIREQFLSTQNCVTKKCN